MDEQAATKDWDGKNAQARMDKLISTYYSDGNLAAVLAPNDGCAAGIRASLQANYHGAWPLITGQDAEASAIEAIRSGTQAITIYKSSSELNTKCIRMIKAVVEGVKPATRVDCHELPLEEIHIYGNDMLTQLKQMERNSGVLLKDADIERIDIARFFKSECYVGLPFVTPYVKTMLEIIRPATYADLLKIYGFACGTGVWIDNAKELLEKGHDLSDVIAFREDVMQYLLRQGVDNKDAFAIAEKVRIGRAQRWGFTSYECNILEEHNVPYWYIQSMKKIGYLFPRSHAVEYMNSFLRMVWYKLYHPAAFYAAILSSKETEGVS